MSDNGASVTVRYASRKDSPTIFFLPCDRRCSTMVVVVLRPGRRLTLADSHDPIPATFHARGSLRTRSNRADKGDDTVVSRAIGSPRSTLPISASTPLPRRRPIYRHGVPRISRVTHHSRIFNQPLYTSLLFPLVRLLIRTSTFETFLLFLDPTLLYYDISMRASCVRTRRHDVSKHSIRSYSIYGYFDVLREDREKRRKRKKEKKGKERKIAGVARSPTHGNERDVWPRAVTSGQSRDANLTLCTRTLFKDR